MPDSHDQRLLHAVAPKGRTNPVPANRYDLVVVGGGTAGLVAAAGAAGLGARVALVEKQRLGGDCLNFGCVPSKAIIAAARANAAIRRLPEMGIEAQPSKVRFSSVMERLRRLRADLSRNDSVERFTGLGVDVFQGVARFSNDGQSVDVDDRKLRFKRVALCMGARPKIPEIPGIHSAMVLTNESIFDLDELPTRLAVIGGGPIGCELAQAFAQLGSHVTLIQNEERILPRDDAEASQRLQAALIRDGVNLRLCATIREIRTQGSVRSIVVDEGSTASTIECDQILVAAGRIPNVEGMNLESAGVRFDLATGVVVDDFLRTSNSRISAAGDVCFPQKFTHAADFLARTLIQNALFLGRARVSALQIPWCTYTSPEIAHLGLNAEEARRRKIAIDTFQQDMQDVDRAVLDGETDGFVKIHVHRGTDRIAGATVVAAHAGDLISEIALAMKNGVGLKKIASTIHPYPTQSEAIRKIGDQYNRTRLTPFALAILKMRLRWMR